MTGTKTKTSTHSRASSDKEVLTLAEAAAYLRVDESDVLQMVQQQGLPGRRIGSGWRFLKPALQGWLCNGPSYKERLMELAGAWQDDPHLVEIVREAYRKRGRPATEDEG